MSDAIAPTPERLRRSTWDVPENSQTTQRRAYRARDVWDELMRRGEIGPPEHQAAGRFETHFQGRMGHDVRIADATSSPVDDSRRSGWERHCHALNEARSALVPDEFRALELLTEGTHDLTRVGLELSRYRQVKQARAYALRLVQGALQRLAMLWGYDAKKPPSFR